MGSTAKTEEPSKPDVRVRRWAYLYQVNGKYRCSKIHPNELELEHSSDYIQPAIAGEKRPGAVFAYNDLIWSIQEADNLEDFRKGLEYEISKISDITHEAFLNE